MHPMNIQPAVREQTRLVALGTTVLTVLMIAVFLILRRFDWTVLTGAALGAGTGILNFFLLAYTVQRAADRVEPLPPLPDDGETDETAQAAKDAEPSDAEQPMSESSKKIRDTIRLSYGLRMLGVGLIAVLGVVLPWFNPVAVLIPLLFPGLVIRLLGARQNKGG